jgi:hypothetical protein
MNAIRSTNLSPLRRSSEASCIRLWVIFDTFTMSEACPLFLSPIPK